MLLKSKFSKILNIIVLIVSIAAFGLIAKVGNIGGQIWHTEIRKSDINAQTGAAGIKEGTTTENGEKGEEED